MTTGTRRVVLNQTLPTSQSQPFRINSDSIATTSRCAPATGRVGFFVFKWESLNLSLTFETARNRPTGNRVVSYIFFKYLGEICGNVRKKKSLHALTRQIIRCPYRCLSALILSSQSNASHLIYSNKEQIQFTYLIKDSIILDLIIAPQSSK